MTSKPCLICCGILREEVERIIGSGSLDVEPLGTRISMVDGPEVSISDAGVVFQRGANGTIRFSTAQGHNTVTLGLDFNAKCVFEW